MLYIFLSLFILRGRVNTSGRGVERRRERIPSRLCTVSTEPDMGLELMNCENISSVEIMSQCLTDWASQVHLECYTFYLYIWNIILRKNIILHLLAKSSITKYHIYGGLNKRNLLSQFQMLEVQNQSRGVSSSCVTKL